MPSTPTVKLCLSFGNVTEPALLIPLDKCNTFAINPLKWLRFLGFAIYGGEGYLSTSRAGPEIDNYTANIEPRSYYFIAEGQACLIDPDVMDDRTSTASDLTARRNEFRTNLIERDGSCVISGDVAWNCTACHIIPHTKGNDYISDIISLRGQAYPSADNVNDIDDTRNGLLLSNLLHRPFATGKLAFLKTPNFALTVDDIPYPPNDPDQETHPANRLTLHHFVDSLGPVLLNVAPHNSDARQPQDTSEWPSAIIVDLFYAAAALNAWSPKPFIKYIRKQSKNAYYDNGDAQDDVNGPSHVDPKMGNQTTGQSGSGRHAGPSTRSKTSSVLLKERRFTDLMDGVSALWTQSSRVNKPKPLEDSHASSLARSRNKGVETWLQSIEGPTTNY